MRSFEGTLTALITPFRDDALDERALRELVERQIAAGISGLVPCGTTGESVTLRTEEHHAVVRIVAEQARGRVPVLAGAGSNCTRHAIELSKLSLEAGADGLLLVCPYYNKPTQAGLVAHFQAILEAAPAPTVLYNIPGRTGVDLGLDALERLLEYRHVVGVKDATGNVLRAQETSERFGDRLAVLSGDDALTLGMMAVGAKGVISVCSNVLPAEVARVVALAAAGDFAAARSAHQALLPWHRALFLETNPAPTKAALAELGLIAPEIRPPLSWPGGSTLERLRALLAEETAR